MTQPISMSMSERRTTKIETIRHSLAHIMAAAVQELYPAAPEGGEPRPLGRGVKFGIGPAIENGFYYDFDFGNLRAKPHKTERETTQKTVTPEDLPKIETKMLELIKQNIFFKKKLASKTEAKKLFKDQPYKLELITELPGKNVTIYKSGDFIDLCAGPHVKSSREIPTDAFKLTKIAGAYWRGNEKNPMLARIYGVAFAAKKELDEYLKLHEEAEKRDHRKIGQALDLFSFHDVSPGAAFWHPKGMVIVRTLEKWWRQEHEKRGYLETSTPIMVKKELFEKSGHWEHYRENIFTLEIEGETYALKPMNCPESALIYSSKIRSYRDLPMRLSEIGRLHRNELSGVLAGLFRVRQITMDDAHIYCRPDQIQDEIDNLLKFIGEFYRMFGFAPEFKLATRPGKFMGDIKLWQKAEKSLEYVLKQDKLPYEVKPKDGAFYGPKIDVHITDALKRSWQMATVQLDFQMPERFDLCYIDDRGKKCRPVMIHRAIFGSFERFIGILLEHFTAALPLWLAPEQIWIIPVGSRHEQYAQEIAKKFRVSGFRFQVKDENETVSKKIREGELQKIPYILVVGDKEMESQTVRVRERGKGDIGEVKIERFIGNVLKEIKKKAWEI